jgi:hypothetical protein
MATWEDVRRLALALPDVEEGTSYRKPAFKVNGRAFVNTAHEDGAIYLPCSDDDAQLLIRAKPEVYFLTPHYEGWGVLLRLAAADEDELAGALEDAYALQALKKPLRPRTAASRRRGSR